MPFKYLYIFSQIYIWKNVCTLTHITSIPIPSIQIFTSTSCICCYLHAGSSIAQENICPVIHKTYPGNIPFSAIMSVWNPAPSIVPVGWDTAISDAWRNWKRGRPKATGCKLIITKRTSATLIEKDRHTKIHTPEKGKLFYLIPMNILNDIDIWI